MATLQRIFYVSRVADPDRPVDLPRLLGTSRRRNRRLDVTGMLACSGRHFAQVLEGAAAAVDQLVADVAADPRHVDFKVVFRKPVTRRDYAEWDMGYIEGFGAGERIEALLAEPVPCDTAEVERFAAKLFAPAF